MQDELGVKNRHLSQDDFGKFQSGQMDDGELLSFMEHISACSYCAQAFSVFEERDMIRVPANFKRDVMVEANRISRNFKTAKLAFARYCAQVAFSVCASLALVFSGSHIKLEKLPKASLPKIEFSITDYVNERLNNFTDSISNSISDSWEEMIHDKKEK